MCVAIARYTRYTMEIKCVCMCNNIDFHGATRAITRMHVRQSCRTMNMNICDLSSEKGPYALLCNYKKTSIFYKFAKIFRISLFGGFDVCSIRRCLRFRQKRFSS